LLGSFLSSSSTVLVLHLPIEQHSTPAVPPTSFLYSFPPHRSPSQRRADAVGRGGAGICSEENLGTGAGSPVTSGFGCATPGNKKVQGRGGGRTSGGGDRDRAGRQGTAAARRPRAGRSAVWPMPAAGAMAVVAGSGCGGGHNLERGNAPLALRRSAALRPGPLLWQRPLPPICSNKHCSLVGFNLRHSHPSASPARLKPATMMDGGMHVVRSSCPTPRTAYFIRVKNNPPYQNRPS
jgi:hypothetical protein